MKRHFILLLFDANVLLNTLFIWILIIRPRCNMIFLHNLVDTLIAILCSNWLYRLTHSWICCVVAIVVMVMLDRWRLKSLIDGVSVITTIAMGALMRKWVWEILSIALNLLFLIITTSVLYCMFFNYKSLHFILLEFSIWF